MLRAAILGTAGYTGQETLDRVLAHPELEPVALGCTHRMRDTAEAERWYGVVPGAWSYGLPEVSPPQGRLIANPGCYATAALLALWPLRDVFEGPVVVVDAKSGMTG